MAEGEQPAGRARLKDVARLADVSPKTVSNVIHDHPHVTRHTRERVEHAIEVLGYRPNLSARNLRAGRSGMLGLALPELHSPYFAELARSVIMAARERSCTVLVEETGGERDRELLLLSGSHPQLIDGLILSPLALDRGDLAARRRTVPLVLLGERVYDGPADHVAIDNVAAARAATEHLVAGGRRRVAAIGAQVTESAQTSHLRLRGYREALADRGIPVEDDLVRRVDHYHRTDGSRAMADLLALPEPPDAVFCFNDLLALGALRATHEQGVRVPEDVAIVGVDDVEDGRFSIPTLTSISPDKEQLAWVAVDLLDSRIRTDERRSRREVWTDFTLVIRESSGRSQARPGG